MEDEAITKQGIGGIDNVEFWLQRGLIKGTIRRLKRVETQQRCNQGAGKCRTDVLHTVKNM